MPDWLLIVIISALITAIAPPLLQRLGKTLRQMGQWLNHWRKYLTGTELHRADAMSTNPPPLWFLQRTLFRWFQNDPQTFYMHMQQIEDHHKNRKAREQIGNLLWVAKPIKDLQLGNNLFYGGHLLGKELLTVDT